MTPLGRALVTGFGLGLCRPASGTFGSLPPALLGVAMVVVSGGGVWAWVWVAAMVVLLLVFAGACLAFGDAAEARFGRKDPGQVVADEVAGMALTLVPLPWLVGVSGVWCAESPVLRGLWLVAVGFVAFRFFDVLKPPPARGLQRVPGGWGILLDDLFAGVYAAGALVLVGRLV